MKIDLTPKRSYFFNVEEQVCIHEISRLPAYLCPPKKEVTDQTTDGPMDGRTNGWTDGWRHPLIESWLTTKEGEKSRQVTQGIIRSAISLPCFFDVLNSQKVFAQRPQYCRALDSG